MALHYFPLPRGEGFSIPADWWVESGMDTFERQSASYQFAADPAVLLIPVVDIHPRTMERRQHLTYGGFDRERMINILRGIASHSLIPPRQQDRATVWRISLTRSPKPPIASTHR
jgi:hypothetical protein